MSESSVPQPLGSKTQVFCVEGATFRITNGGRYGGGCILCAPQITGESTRREGSPGYIAPHPPPPTSLWPASWLPAV